MTRARLTDGDGRELTRRRFCCLAAVAFTGAAGCRADIWTIAVPSLMRSVEAPHHASGVRQSEPYASAVHTESNPRRSASRMTSGMPGGGPPAQ